MEFFLKNSHKCFAIGIQIGAEKCSQAFEIFIGEQNNDTLVTKMS